MKNRDHRPGQRKTIAPHKVRVIAYDRVIHRGEPDSPTSPVKQSRSASSRVALGFLSEAALLCCNSTSFILHYAVKPRFVAWKVGAHPLSLGIKGPVLD
jgi:hypothetical protein